MAEAALKALSSAGIAGPKFIGKNDKKEKRNEDIFKMQANIKNNSHDLQNFVNELDEWTKEIEPKDKDSKLRDQNKNVSGTF